MELTGKLHAIFEAKEKTPTFRTREFIVEVSDGRFPQYIKFELVNDKCKLIDSFEVGQNITVSFDITGREWTNPAGEKVYFNSLRAWKINLTEAGDYHTSIDDTIDYTADIGSKDEPPPLEPPF
ncbi:MAG: DUF3127 domain-containing protein [Ignavibacteria bacterium]